MEVMVLVNAKITQGNVYNNLDENAFYDIVSQSKLQAF